VQSSFETAAETISDLENVGRQRSKAGILAAISRHFRCSNLKANKVSKSEGTSTVEYAYHLYKCINAVYRKLSK